MAIFMSVLPVDDEARSRPRPEVCPRTAPSDGHVRARGHGLEGADREDLVAEGPREPPEEPRKGAEQERGGREHEPGARKQNLNTSLIHE